MGGRSTGMSGFSGKPLEKCVSIALSAQFLVSMINCLHRSDVTPVLCLIGFYSVNERKRNATRTYLVFLILSIFLDVIWLSVYGNYIYSYLRVVEFEYTGQIKDNHLLEFVFFTSIILLVIKMLSVISVYKFYVELDGSGGRSSFDSFSSTDLEAASEDTSLMGSQEAAAKPTELSKGYQDM